jgi:hypothetical protein
MLRVRFIEGPPRLLPGDCAAVVVELEGITELRTGEELELIEQDRVVGLLTICRLWPPPWRCEPARASDAGIGNDDVVVLGMALEVGDHVLADSHHFQPL